MPAGFTATLFASGLAHPRRLLVLPNGDVLVAEQSAGYLTLLRAEGDGKAQWITRHVEDLNRPYGLAWRTTMCWWPTRTRSGACRIRSGPCAPGAPRPRNGPSRCRRRTASPSPAPMGPSSSPRRASSACRSGTRIGPSRSIPRPGPCSWGSGRPAISASSPSRRPRFNASMPTAGTRQTYASGVRNPTGLAFHPQTGDLWAVVQERDGLGDNLPSDYLIRVQEGGFYGWPYAYIGPHPQPGFANLAPDKVKATITPDLLFEAHSSALDLVFYDAEQFPVEMQGSAFVALKGSWNRSEPTGYKVVRVPFKDGKPAGYYENFMTGFWAAGEQRAEVWGRPAALAVAKDGCAPRRRRHRRHDLEGELHGRGASRRALGRNDRHGRRPRQEVSTHGARDRPPKDGPRLPIAGALGRCHRRVCVAAAHDHELALQTIRVTWSALTLPLKRSGEERDRLRLTAGKNPPSMEGYSREYAMLSA